MPNIVLIGMPGSGKSSIGKYVAKKLSMSLIDIDEMIVDFVKMSISDIFVKEGEEKFREYESLCLMKAVKCKESVISTGGGIILKEENMALLQKEGIIFFIDRSLENIMKSSLHDRPLVQNDAEKLQALYHKRLPLYQKYARHTVKNNRAFKDACEHLIAIYHEEDEEKE